MGKHKLLSLDTHKYKTTFTSTTKIVLRFSNMKWMLLDGCPAQLTFEEP
jgi:hypothetical protein